MWTRRRFLAIVGGAIGAFGAAWLYTKRSAGSFYRRLVELEPAPTGPIGDRHLATLLAVTTALVGSEIDADRYLDFFRFHAENIPGYGRLYRRFAEHLDAKANASAGRSFAESGPATQRSVLEKAKALRVALNAGDRWTSLRLAAFDSEWFLYERYIVREILTLFARTDAWILAGYGPPPGVPRGLEAYREAPALRSP